MGLTTGLVAVKGDYLNDLAVITHAFRLVDAGKDVKLDNYEEAENIIEEEYHERVDEYRERRIVWHRDGWTLLEDMSFLHCTNEEALENISRQLETPVFALLTQGTSNSFGFWYFDQQKMRSFFCSDGVVTDNYGTPLPQETGFNINEQAFYDDVHGVAKAMGINWHDMENHHHFIVKTLEPNPEYRAELEDTINHQYDQSSGQEAKKPWWKFW